METKLKHIMVSKYFSNFVGNYQISSFYFHYPHNPKPLKLKLNANKNASLFPLSSNVFPRKKENKRLQDVLAFELMVPSALLGGAVLVYFTTTFKLNSNERQNKRNPKGSGCAFETLS